VARQGDLPWKTDPDRGSPAVKRVIPSADDARQRVETAWVWISVMEATRGHYRVAAGDRGTVRSASTSAGAEVRRNRAPSCPVWARCNRLLPLGHFGSTCPVLFRNPTRTPGKRHNALFVRFTPLCPIRAACRNLVVLLPQRWLENASSQPLAGQSGHVPVYPLIECPDWLPGLDNRPRMLVAAVLIGSADRARQPGRSEDRPPVGNHA
jgi:hypothetical protein